MELLRNEQGQKAVQCDLFEETQPFRPQYLVALTEEEGLVSWYVIGDAVQRDRDWIVPLQIAPDQDEARRTGHILNFVVGRDARLANA